MDIPWDKDIIIITAFKLALWTLLYYYLKWSKLSEKRVSKWLWSQDIEFGVLMLSFYRFGIKILPLIYVLGVAFILGFNLAPVWAALAALPLAMSLGAKSVAENIWGRLVIHWTSKFKIGDELKVDGQDVIIDNIGLIATAIYDPSTCKEGHTFEIPNGQIVKAKIGTVGRKYGSEDG